MLFVGGGPEAGTSQGRSRLRQDATHAVAIRFAVRADAADAVGSAPWWVAGRTNSGTIRGSPSGGCSFLRTITWPISWRFHAPTSVAPGLDAHAIAQRAFTGAFATRPALCVFSPDSDRGRTNDCTNTLRLELDEIGHSSPVPILRWVFAACLLKTFRTEGN
jgi:hypothetical protein